MIVPDVNVLLYAHIDAFPQHPTARAWWEQVLAGPQPLGLCAPVVFGFVRIATNRRVFVPPMHLHEALAAVEGWMACPRVRWLVPGPDHFRHVADLLRIAGTSRDLSTDAQIAAYALEHHATVATTDTDFHRFSGVKSAAPF